MENTIKRWRLILGNEVQEKLEEIDTNGLMQMSKEDLMIDDALSSIYGSKHFTNISQNDKLGGKGRSLPKASKWIGDIQTIFEKDIAKIIQNDAIERAGLKSLLLEPEILESIEPDINLASTIMQIKEQIPSKSKDGVRLYIKKVVEEINKKLADDVKRVVSSKVNKKEHSPIPSASAIDFKYTIRKNIRNYNLDLQAIIPEKVYFFDRANKSDANKYHIILDVDQSGSMGQSVIYSSVLGCILASISSIKTKVVAFDTSVIDLSEQSQDPVDLLYGFNLGGGTDIDKSLKYCQTLIENPKKTIFFLVSDLYEGGNASSMLRRLEHMKESGVNVMCLLAISDDGKPFYDDRMVTKISKMGIPCFACSPNKLPDLIDCALNNKTFEG